MRTKNTSLPQVCVTIAWLLLRLNDYVGTIDSIQIFTLT